MAYEKKVWANKEDIPESKLSQYPRFDAENMNRIEEGIENSINNTKELKTVSLNIYKSFEALNTELKTSFNAKTSINDIIGALPNNTGLKVDIVDTDSTVYPVPYGILTIYKIRDNRVEVEFVSSMQAGSPHYNKRWVGQHNLGVFSGFNQIYTEYNKPTAEDVGALSNKGGEINGDVIVSTSNNPSTYCEKINTDGTTSETIVRQNGGYSSFISRNNPSRTKTGDYRSLQIYDPDKLDSDSTALKMTVLRSGALTTYNLFGAHNKPTGIYKGEGTSAKRTISVGGTGNALVVYSNGGDCGIVTPNGAFIGGDGSYPEFIRAIVSPSSYGIHFENGILTIADDHRLNASGVIYTYQVL